MKTRRMRVIYLIGLGTLAACNGERFPARVVRAPLGLAGDLATYQAAGARVQETLETLEKMSPHERVAFAVRILENHRNEASLRYLREVVAVLDRHGYPVDDAARHVVAAPGERITPVELRETQLAGYALISGPGITMLGAPPPTESQKAAGLMPFAMWRELRDVTVRFCPDRAMRLSVLTDDQRPSDVEGPGDRGYLERWAEERRLEEEQWRDFFASLSDRPEDPINISAVDFFSELDAMTFGMTLYYYANSLAAPGPHELTETAAYLRSAALACLPLDPSPEARRRIEQFVKTVDEEKENTRQMEKGAVETVAQHMTTLAFLAALEKNDRAGMERLATPAFAQELKRTPDVWQALAGSRVRALWVLGISEYTETSRAGPGVNVGIRVEELPGAPAVQKPTWRDLWLGGNGNDWRVAGFAGISSTAQQRAD